MDDNYGACAWCGWNGKLLKDGTMRKHRPQADAGTVGRTGSLPQQPNTPPCKGSYETPYYHSTN